MSLNYGLYTATVLHCYAVKHFVCFVIKRALVNKFPLPLPLPPSVVCCSFIRSLAARCSLTHSLTRSECISIYGNYFDYCMDSTLLFGGITVCRYLCNERWHRPGLWFCALWVHQHPQCHCVAVDAGAPTTCACRISLSWVGSGRVLLGRGRVGSWVGSGRPSL